MSRPNISRASNPSVRIRPRPRAAKAMAIETVAASRSSRPEGIALAMSARQTLLELLDAALRAVDGRACVASALPREVKPTHLFAIGKAASSMALGARAVLGGTAETLLITKDGHVAAELRGAPGVAIFESAHPVPDARSLAAGEELAR